MGNTQLWLQILVSFVLHYNILKKPLFILLLTMFLCYLEIGEGPQHNIRCFKQV